MNILETGWKSVDWAIMAQDKHRWREYINEISGSIKDGKFLNYLRALLHGVSQLKYRLIINGW